MNSEIKINLIKEPRIFKIGETKMDYNGLEDFIDFVETEGSEYREATKLRDVYNSENSDMDKLAEIAGRVCYQSYFSGRDTEAYFDHILEDAHGNILEHPEVHFIVTGVSRSLTHELIRHRVGTGVSEMSQRFVGANEKSGVWNFVVPAAYRDYMDDPKVVEELIRTATQDVEEYLKHKKVIHDLLKGVVSGRALTKSVNEAAREFLPNWVETRLYWKMNVRSMRHILDKRGSEHADRQIREFCLSIMDIVDGMELISMSDVSHDGKLIDVKHKGV